MNNLAQNQQIISHFRSNLATLFTLPFAGAAQAAGKKNKSTSEDEEEPPAKRNKK